MDLVNRIRQAIEVALYTGFQFSSTPKDMLVTETKPEFTGDYTVVLFNFAKQLRMSPDALGTKLGEALVQVNSSLFASFNVIKGFLNLVVTDQALISFLHTNHSNEKYGTKAANGERVMIEYSSPNTNKPLHLGHLRNNFLGWSVAAIHEANGYEVVKTCIANDRGIHICKSMIAWQKYAHGATPLSTGVKGDHFVGDYYVLFGVELKKQVEELMAAGMTKETAEKEAPLMKGAQQMLIDWEAGKPEVISLWSTMNQWVYDGFDVTYKRIGSDFDKIYYESDTYLLGKGLVAFGLQKKVFYQEPDNSVWIDLTADGLDQKIVQRKDGTAVYMTQDIGLAEKKYEEYKAALSIYVVADEQNYHFKVLKLICAKLGLPSAPGLFHLSYGLVELPSGRMKTREGTVVDADDLIEEMVSIAGKHTAALGKVDDFTAAERVELFDTIGLGALKFFLLRVDPKKRMVFNPDESIDFHGFTGPFIQYTHARIKSILRKETVAATALAEGETLLPLEKQIVVALERFNVIMEQARIELNPSLIAVYAFELAKSFSSFYSAHSVSKAETESKKMLRLQLCQLTAIVLKSSLALLGIRSPERM